MELLSRTRSSAPVANSFSGSSHPAKFQYGFDRRSGMGMGISVMPEMVEEEGRGKVHVAVGKSVGKSVELLRWALRTFTNREICIVHVHLPTPWIPTLLGNLPASKANREVVSAYRKEERKQMRKLLFYYLTICSQSKVKVSIIAGEAAQVEKGIVDLINKYGIRKLVMGAEPQRSCITSAKEASRQKMHLDSVRYGLSTKEGMLGREMPMKAKSSKNPSNVNVSSVADILNCCLA